MTGVLLALVIVLAGLQALDLLLTVGLVRRVREHQSQIEAVGARGLHLGIPVGTQVPPVDVLDVRDQEVPRTWPGDTVVGFFSTTCDACREHLPEYLTWASQRNRLRNICVVDGPIEDALEMARGTDDVARLVLAPHAKALADKFEISGVPVLFEVVNGRVSASGLRVTERPFAQA